MNDTALAVWILIGVMFAIVGVPFWGFILFLVICAIARGIYVAIESWFKRDDSFDVY